MIINVNDNNIGLVIDKCPFLIIDLWAPWCAPCKVMGQTIDKIAGKYSDVTFGKLDIDSNLETVSKYNIKSIPTLLFFKDGKYIKSLTGSRSESDLLDEINKLK